MLRTGTKMTCPQRPSISTPIRASAATPCAAAAVDRAEGTPRISAPVAAQIPLMKAIPERSPAKLPGPVPTVQRRMSCNSRPMPANVSRIHGGSFRSLSRLAESRLPLNRIWSPSATAKTQVSDVSIAACIIIVFLLECAIGALKINLY